MHSTLSALEQDGFRTVDGGLDQVREEAQQLGWREGGLRRGVGPVERLRPLTKLEARPYSLSAVVGRAAQPFHTDGAHMSAPPDVVALVSHERSHTATRILRFENLDSPLDALRNGVFRVALGRASFLAPALNGETLRFDSCCMTPCDPLARSVAAYFSADHHAAVRHEWSSRPEVLLLDNRRVLHAREAVATGDEDRVLERVAFWLPDDKAEKG